MELSGPNCDKAMVYHTNIMSANSSFDYLFSLGEPREPELATHVLQFIFLGDSGFRFPLAQYPSAHCTPSDLYFVFWKGVLKMLQFGFV